MAEACYGGTLPPGPPLRHAEPLWADMLSKTLDIKGDAARDKDIAGIPPYGAWGWGTGATLIQLSDAWITESGGA